MAVVARILPRHWDGRRLLRFLTGLALIALAFAVRVDGPAAASAALGPAPAAASAPVQTVRDDAASDVGSGVGSGIDGDRSVERPAAIGPVDATLSVPGVPPVTTTPAGAIPPAYGSRAPPAA